MTVAGSRLLLQARTVSIQGEHTMGLPAAEQRVLDMIENELRISDQQLATAFAAFTKFARGTRMPRPERLTAWRRLITRMRRRRVGLLRPVPDRNHPRKTMRSAGTIPPPTPCWPISQCRSDSVRHWPRTGTMAKRRAPPGREGLGVARVERAGPIRDLPGFE